MVLDGILRYGNMVKPARVSVITRFLTLWVTNARSLSLFFTASRAACLGERVALFTVPFEARPADTTRKEVFRQQASGSHGSWFSPTAVPSGVLTDLTPSHEILAGPVPKPRNKRIQRRLGPTPKEKRSGKKWFNH